MAVISGWIATALIFIAGTLPLAFRFRNGKRAAPTSRPIRTHVAFGLLTSIGSFVHTVTIMPALGSSSAVAGGMMALAPGALAFFVLVAHTGIGLQLRNERLKNRAEQRKKHGITAAIVVACVVVHVIALRR